MDLCFTLPCGSQESEGDPERIFFTLDKYQETFISDIVIKLQKVELIFRQTDEGRTDRRGSRNSDLDSLLCGTSLCKKNAPKVIYPPF